MQNRLSRFFSATIGLKITMAVSGLLFIGFLIGHLAGNLGVFSGRETVNAYALLLHSFPKLLWSVRIGLIFLAVSHIWTSIALTNRNRAARPVPYASQVSRQASFASRTMMWSGLVILAFVTYHLAHFTWNITHPEFAHLIDAEGRHDVYTMMVMGFQDPFVSSFYILAQCLLAMHVSHGFSSAAQTLGLTAGFWAQGLRTFGRYFAVALSLGYMSIPVAIWLGVVTI